MCYEKISFFNEAEKDLLIGLKLEPDNINLVFHLANIQEKLDKSDLAKKNYLT